MAFTAITDKGDFFEFVALVSFWWQASNYQICGFLDNAFNYLLFLRLVPAAPFWVVNLVPALTGVRVGTFIAATFIGIIPGAFVYSLAGEGFASVIAQGNELSLAGVLTPPVIGAFVGLGALALIPIVLKRFGKGK